MSRLSGERVRTALQVAGVVALVVVFVIIVFAGLFTIREDLDRTTRDNRAHQARRCAMLLAASRDSRDSVDVLEPGLSGDLGCAYWLTADTVVRP